jgi:hypothetical protein
MKPKSSSLYRIVCLAILGTLYAAMAGAQVSTSLSQPLDSNLNGLDSNVAPIPSTEIEPGANSLMTPDEHVLPYDAIGASIVATPISPFVTQYNTLSRMPFQVDVSLKDASILTGLHPQIPISVIEVIDRNRGRLGSSAPLQSSGSSVNPFSTTNALSTIEGRSALQASGLSSGGNLQASSWRVGSVGATLAIDSIQPPPPPTTASSPKPLTLVGEDVPQSKVKAKEKSRTKNTDSQQAAQTQDYSKSPLEAVDSANENQSAAETSVSPFKVLGQSNFLSPDITSIGSRSTQPAYRSSARAQSDALNARRQSLSGNSLDTRNEANALVSRDEARLMKHTSRAEQRAEQRKRQKWHNPILQQMENRASTNQ